MKNILDKVVEKLKTLTSRSILFFFEKRAIYEVKWKNFVERAGDR